jgi:hypothetical protein
MSTIQNTFDTSNPKTMRVVFLIVILIHALIHTMAFVKAFELAELKEFTNPVSKPMGLVWLSAFLLLAVAAILFLVKSPNWWIWGLTGVILSQILIFLFWPEAKFGTIPNIIILLVVIVAFAQFTFEKKIQEEIDYIQKESHIQNSKIITEDMLVDLPPPVRNWLEKSGIVGKPAIRKAHMEQVFEMKLKPEQKNWFRADAEQFFSTYPPAFVWTAEMQIMPFLGAFGRDKFIDGKGEMLFKLLSIFPVANDGYNPQVNESALQRFLGEIIWIPSAALEDYVAWEMIDDNSAKATVSYKGTSGSGVFTFNDSGELVKFTAMRFMGSGPEAKRMEWFVSALETKEMNGIRIPVRCSATWRLETGDWTWAQFEVKNYTFEP